MKVNPINELTNTSNMSKTAHANRLSPSYDKISIAGSNSRNEAEVSKQQILKQMKTVSTISFNVSSETKKLIDAAERAPMFLVKDFT